MSDEEQQKETNKPKRRDLIAEYYERKAAEADETSAPPASEPSASDPAGETGYQLLDLEAMRRRLAREREPRNTTPPAGNEFTDAMLRRLARDKARGTVKSDFTEAACCIRDRYTREIPCRNGHLLDACPVRRAHQRSRSFDRERER
jgi:hypothetical protein